MRPIEQAATVYLEGGLSIIPINAETKRPAWKLLPQEHDPLTGEPMYIEWINKGDGTRLSVVTKTRTGTPKRGWKVFQTERPTEADVTRWMRTGIKSIAVVTGAISGNVEILDFDDRNGGTWFDAWKTLAGDAIERYGLPVQRTGGNGYQLAWRCSEIEGNQKLAWIEAPEEKAGKKAMIETRGEGGYALLPPSLHPSGRNYELLHGKFSRIPEITPEVRNFLIDCARRLNQVEAPAQAPRLPTNTAYTGDSWSDVVDAFNRGYSIESALARYGYTQGHGNRWSRPGKPDSMGVSILGDGKAYAHSSNDPMCYDRRGDNRPFSSFDLYAYFEHGDDYSAATKAAAEELGMQLGSKLHTLLYVEGYEDAKTIRDLMFPHGWVVRGCRTDGNVKLDDISKYENVLLLATDDSSRRILSRKISMAIPFTRPLGMSVAKLVSVGMLKPYLEGALTTAAIRAQGVESAPVGKSAEPAPVEIPDSGNELEPVVAVVGGTVEAGTLDFMSVQLTPKKSRFYHLLDSWDDELLRARMSDAEVEEMMNLADALGLPIYN